MYVLNIYIYILHIHVVKFSIQIFLHFVILQNKKHSLEIQGCIWCQDPDPSALVPDGIPRNIAKGCLIETANCIIKYERYI
jgi:hypothetical protein